MPGLGRLPLRFYRKRRIVAGLLGLLVIWTVLHYTAILSSERPAGYYVERNKDWPLVSVPVGLHDSKAEQPDGPAAGDYDGHVWLNLTGVWQSASATNGYRSKNHNVLFLASSLQSAASLIPVACEMAAQGRNDVHFALMSRDALALDAIVAINGVDAAACTLYWHDARPDFPGHSSDHRAKVAAGAALAHLHRYLHPQVLLTDELGREEASFAEAIRAKAAALGSPLVEIPAAAADRLMWITRLDSASLASWHQPTIDVVLTAAPSSSGSLVRLLRSLQQADYSGLAPPRITIDLPHDVDSSTVDLLSRLRWPYAGNGRPDGSSELILRHRIARQHLSPVESSVRALEAFWPASPVHSHVLLLSPQAELSPLFFHYAKYAVLEYGYSADRSTNAEALFGISLESPAHHVNGSAPFHPPGVKTMLGKRLAETGDAPFLWQAPHLNMIVAAEKWIELHSFLTHRLAKQGGQTAPAKRPKIVAATEPSWTEYLLELMRARNYFIAYPALPSPDALLTVPTDLYALPEEFTAKAEGSREEDSAPPADDHDPFLVKVPMPKPRAQPEFAWRPSSLPLHLVLPFNGRLPKISSLPRLSYAGDIRSTTDTIAKAAAFSQAFRTEVGGCKTLPEGKSRVVRPGIARDLFCYRDDRDEDLEVTVKLLTAP